MYICVYVALSLDSPTVHNSMATFAGSLCVSKHSRYQSHLQRPTLPYNWGTNAITPGGHPKGIGGQYDYPE